MSFVVLAQLPEWSVHPLLAVELRASVRCCVVPWARVRAEGH